jgi:hypothetical protein
MSSRAYRLVVIRHRELISGQVQGGYFGGTCRGLPLSTGEPVIAQPS